MDKDVVICRCMEITYGDVLRAIEEGAVTVTGVKKRVNSGMGMCQGKYCEILVAQIISQQTGRPLSEILPDTKRAPTRPIETTSFLE